MSANYFSFGLGWAIPFSCPELHPIMDKQPADVVVRLGNVPKSLNGARPAGPLLQVTPEQVLFRFPSMAAFLINGGDEIIIQSTGGIDHQVRLFLFGTVSALLLMQRGLLPLHASGIVTPKGAVLFAGHSGYGKSTLLASFLRRGYPMLTDDLAAIELTRTAPHVFPSFPSMKLWQDSATQVGQETAGLQRVRDESLDKFSVPVEFEMAKGAVPLYAIYALQPLNKTAVSLESLTHAKKFNVFLDHTWQKLTLRRQGRHAAHFKQVTAVANQVRVVRVYRPEKPFLLDELTDAIEADFLA